MANSGNANEWKSVILKRLRDRNRAQTYIFSGLIYAHNKLFESTTSLKSANIQLSVETQRLREENLQIQASGGGSGSTNEKTQVLEHKLFKLQEELTELHRKKSENSQLIINLNASLQEKDKELQQRDAQLVSNEATMGGLKSALKNLEQTIMELEATNQMLKDEHQALQLAFTALEDKYRKIQDENNELVLRWMNLKSKDADRMNAENDKFVKKRQRELKKELAEAASEPTHITEPVGFMPPIMFGVNVSLPTKAQCTFDAHDGEVHAIEWSNTGSLFGTGGMDRKLKLWEVINGKCEMKAMLVGSNAGIMSIDFDLQENLVIGASNDFASRVWSLSDHRLRHTLTGHSGKVLTAKFMTEGNRVVSGSHDRTIKVWDLISKACVKTIFAGSSCNDLVSTDDNTVISGHFDKRVRFWDWRCDSSTNEILLQGRITSLDLSADRLTLLGCTKDNTIKVIDLRTNHVFNTLCHDNFRVAFDWTRARFSPDGEYVCAGSQDGSVLIWNSAKGKVEQILKDHSHPVISCAWHPQGHSILSCEKQRRAILWSDF